MRIASAWMQNSKDKGPRERYGPNYKTPRSDKLTPIEVASWICRSSYATDLNKKPLFEHEVHETE